MKLKLMAPFSIDKLRLNPTEITNSPAGYAREWDTVAGELNSFLKNLSSGKFKHQTTRFMHGTAYTEESRSRYRTISTHSLPRQLHIVETEIQLTIDALREFIKDGKNIPVPENQYHEQLIAANQDQLPDILIRLYDHGVGIIELDLDIPSEWITPDAVSGQAAIEPRLDYAQTAGIQLVENLGEALGDWLIQPLIREILKCETFGKRFLLLRNDGQRKSPTRALWVTRSLIVEPDDPIALMQTNHENNPESASLKLRRQIFAHWLKDVGEAETIVEQGVRNAKTQCTRWLNYLFCEQSYGKNYPQQGWRRKAGTDPDANDAVPFCETWDALLIAQYYYSAFDQLQSQISHMLSLSVTSGGQRQMNDVKRHLNTAVGSANILEVEFEENSKYYSRRVGGRISRILEGWDFENSLRGVIRRRIEDCDNRLQEFHSRILEKNSFYTDLLLLGLGVVAIIEILLHLIEYGRTMTTDPNMAIYDSSSLSILRWLGSTPTDAMLLAGSIFSICLVAIYAFFRSTQSRV